MIDLLNKLLRQLFNAKIPGIKDEARVRFQPPDDDWRTYVGNLNALALNVYLFDLRENRTLRSNERTRQLHNGKFKETMPPRRMDCHYLITAWSPATASAAVEPTLEEHGLLARVAAVLMNNEPLVPSRVYENPNPPGWPTDLADAELPTVVLPPDGFFKYAEFWGTMGAKHPWRPAVYLIVTLPVILLPKDLEAPMVTKREITMRQVESLETAETSIHGGGTIHGMVTSSGGWVVRGASIQLESTDGQPLQTTESDETGRFRFSGLKAGNYKLRAHAPGLGEDRPHDVELPSDSIREYNVELPLMPVHPT